MELGTDIHELSGFWGCLQDRTFNLPIIDRMLKGFGVWPEI